MVLPFRNVVLVDDDQFIIDMYRTKLEGEGATVVAFPHPQKALRAFREGKVSADVVLIDMVMPEIDGVAFLEELRKLPQGKDVVAIMLTNQGQDTDRERAFAAGADGFLVKADLTPTAALREIERIVREARKRRAPSSKE